MGGVVKEARPFASLSSSLLARKGGARPAMRPNSGKSLEDLGWNDMGLVAPSPADLAGRHVEPQQGGHMPVPVVYQAEIEEVFSAPAEIARAPEPEPIVAAPRGARKAVARPIKSRVGASKPIPMVTSETVAAVRTQSKAAFTLRLDGDRHMRLKLACVLSNRSAQKVVTEALDAYLAKMPEIETLAGHMPVPKTSGQN